MGKIHLFKSIVHPFRSRVKTGFIRSVLVNWSENIEKFNFKGIPSQVEHKTAPANFCA